VVSIHRQRRHSTPVFPVPPPPTCRPTTSFKPHHPNGCRVLQTTGAVQSWRPQDPPFTDPFPTHQPIDFDAEVNLFHFNLLRCVGKGAFGKVYMGLCCRTGFLRAHPCLSFHNRRRSESFSTSRRRTSTPSNTSTRLVASGRKPSQISYKREDCSKRSVATLHRQPAWPPPTFTFGSHPSIIVLS